MATYCTIFQLLQALTVVGWFLSLQPKFVTSQPTWSCWTQTTSPSLSHQWSVVLRSGLLAAHPVLPTPKFWRESLRSSALQGWRRGVTMGNSEGRCCPTPSSNPNTDVTLTGQHLLSFDRGLGFLNTYHWTELGRIVCQSQPACQHLKVPKVQNKSLMRCLALARRFCRHIHLCCSTHRCVFLPDMTTLEREMNWFSKTVITQEHQQRQNPPNTHHLTFSANF